MFDWASPLHSDVPVSLKIPTVSNAGYTGGGYLSLQVVLGCLLTGYTGGGSLTLQVVLGCLLTGYTGGGYLTLQVVLGCSPSMVTGTLEKCALQS